MGEKKRARKTEEEGNGYKETKINRINAYLLEYAHTGTQLRTVHGGYSQFRLHRGHISGYLYRCM